MINIATPLTKGRRFFASRACQRRASRKLLEALRRIGLVESIFCCRPIEGGGAVRRKMVVQVLALGVSGAQAVSGV
jgi:hypothetical protein